MTGTDALEPAARESGYGLGSILRGLPGHPLHPALAHAAIGGYTVGAVLATLGRAGVSEHDLAKGWWLAVLVGFAASAVAALTGLADFLALVPGSPLRRAGITHIVLIMPSMPAFLATLLYGHSGYTNGTIPTLPFVLTLAGFVLVTIGGAVGGHLVYGHGARVAALRRMHAT